MDYISFDAFNKATRLVNSAEFEEMAHLQDFPNLRNLAGCQC